VTPFFSVVERLACPALHRRWTESRRTDADVQRAVEPIFQHVLTTYASEAKNTASM
jgi:hypothetical protein